MTLLLRRTAALAVVGPAVLGLGLTALPSSAEAAVPAIASVNVSIRAKPTTASQRLATLNRGQRVVAVGAARHGWVPVKFRGGHAYVAAKYVSTTPRYRPSAPSRLSTAGVKVTTNTLNLRTGPSTRYRVIKTLPIGTMLVVTSRQAHGFAIASVGGRTGWVSLAYLATMEGTARAHAPAARATRSAVRRPVPVSSAARGRLALAFARQQLGEPYRFGATGPNSWDCSGLTQAAWRAAGINIPRTSQQQFARGGSHIARSQLRAGDLVFFYGPSPHHVGMYIGGGRIINAPRPGKGVEYTSIGTMPYAGAVRP